MVRNPNSPLEPNRIAKYIKLNKCDRYFKISVDKTYDDSEAFDRPRDSFQEATTRQQIIQKYAGDEFEWEVLHDLREIVDSTMSLDDLHDDPPGGDYVDSTALTTSLVQDICEDFMLNGENSDSYLIHQPGFRGDIESWRIRGDADLLFAHPINGTIAFHIIDVKLTQEEQAQHQIQTAIYSLLLKALLDDIGVNEDAYEIRTGVLTPDDDPAELTLDTLPRFTRRTREGDVIRMLKEGGEFTDRADAGFDDMNYRIESKCENCPHSEICLTQSVEDAAIELLGLKQSIQTQLKDEDIETLYDLAGLGEPPYSDDETINPTDTGPDAELVRTDDVFDRLSADPNFNANLTELVLKARTLLDKIDSDDYHARNGYGYEWLLRTGYSDLPSDEPPESYADQVDFEPGSMIRAYLNVQHDGARDRLVSLGATVDATISDTGPVSVSETSSVLPEDEDAAAWEEKRLLKSFIGKLADAMREVQDGIDLSGSPYAAAPIHFYVFSPEERDNLIDRLETYADPPATIEVDTDDEDTIQEATVLLNFLGHRPGLDEHMFSVVEEEEIDARQAHRVPTNGLVQLAEYYSPDGDLERKSYTDWQYTPEDTDRLPDGVESVDLTDVFNWRLFNYQQPYKRDQNEPPEFLLDDTERDNDGWYPNRFRSGAKIPLEYIWAAAGRINDDWVADMEDEIDEMWVLEHIRYHGYNTSGSVPIEVEDVSALVEEYTDALMRVERSVWWKTTSHNKTPTSIREFKQMTNTGADTLAEASLEYLGLEYTAQKNERTEEYHQRPRDRLANGESVIFRVEETEERGGKLRVHGSLAYDVLENISAPEEYRDVIRTKDAGSSGSGDYLSATPVDREDVWNPNDIEQGILSRVVNLAPTAGNSAREITVEMSAFNPMNGTRPDDGFLQVGSRAPRGWDIDARDDSGSRYAVYPGRIFLLDPRPSTITSNLVEEALEHPRANAMYNLIKEIRSGETTLPSSMRFSGTAVEDFVDWQTEWAGENFDNDYGIIPPNEHQREFITETSREISVLHGAPGTGKTKGGIGPTVASRLYAAGMNGDQCRGLITGASNKAIDEAMEDIAAVVEAYREHGDTDAFDNVRLVRITGVEKPTDPGIDQEPVDGVEYVTYSGAEPDATELHELYDRLVAYDTNGTEDPGEIPHTLVFATPTRSWLLTQAASQFPSADELLTNHQKLYDLIVADEASMLALPRLFLAGAFYNRGGQVLLAGDHRQMPPVNQWDWSNEYRPSVMAFAPYLSSLNYVRLLKGEELKVLDDEMRDQVQVAIDHMDRDELPIPITQFPQSYRSHQLLPEFLQRHVYEADNMDYYSERTETMAEPSPSTDGLAAALDPEKPITLITYDGTSAQQSNRVEERITHHLIDCLSPEESSGVVTPHNAQRSLIERSVRDLEQPHSPVDIDTVERFQGGERDVMMMNGTVSDPDYIDAESEFLLNLNRVNVAVSRMKKKLIIIASKSIFQHTPLDTDEYEHTKLWKGLATELGVLHSDSRPEWGGALSEFTGEHPDGLPRNPSLEVYGLGPADDMSSLGADVTSRQG